MLSRKAVIIIGVIIIVAVHVFLLSNSSKRPLDPVGFEHWALPVVAPFQNAASSSVRFFRRIWRHYFFLVSVSQANERLTKSLNAALERTHACIEIERSNKRLRGLLQFRDRTEEKMVAAEVIGKDPSPWFKSLVIDKGAADGLDRGLPVIIPAGVVGLITDISGGYAKVLLIIDQNSAVDALVQRTRARGVVKGRASRRCNFEYALSKHDIKEGDAVISSGLDGVFPKGLRIGEVTEVTKRQAGIFQEVALTPYVDFERLEEVFVIVGADAGLSDEEE